MSCPYIRDAYGNKLFNEDYTEELKSRLEQNIQIKHNMIETLEGKDQRIEELESTIAKHERREDSHVKQIEKLEAVADAAGDIIKYAKQSHPEETDFIIGWTLFRNVMEALKEAGKLK